MKDIDHTKFDQWQFICNFRLDYQTLSGRIFKIGFVNISSKQTETGIPNWRGYMIHARFLLGPASVVALIFGRGRNRLETHYLTLIPRLDFSFTRR